MGCWVQCALVWALALDAAWVLLLVLLELLAFFSLWLYRCIHHFSFGLDQSVDSLDREWEITVGSGDR